MDANLSKIEIQLDFFLEKAIKKYVREHAQFLINDKVTEILDEKVLNEIEKTLEDPALSVLEILQNSNSKKNKL